MTRCDVPEMTAGRAALLGLMDRYLAALMDVSITLLEVHKLMYFLQEAGQPLRLRYVKAPFGPYAENLRPVLRAIEGHLIAGYADGGEAPECGFRRRRPPVPTEDDHLVGAKRRVRLWLFEVVGLAVSLS